METTKASSRCSISGMNRSAAGTWPGSVELKLIDHVDPLKNQSQLITDSVFLPSYYSFYHKTIIIL